MSAMHRYANIPMQNCLTAWSIKRANYHWPLLSIFQAVKTFKMHSNAIILLVLFICVSGYKISRSDSNTSDEEKYSLLFTNQSNDDPSNDLTANDQSDYQRKSSSPIDEDDARSEALIKKIHPFVYPKQFNTIDGIPPNRGFNVTNEHLMEIRDELVDNASNNERLGETLTPPDQKHAHSDLMPLSTHLFDRQPAKHAPHFQYGYIDRPIGTHHQQLHHSILPHPNHCLLGLLHGCDPLMLLGIMGFLAYVINSILGLVNRIGLPPLLTTTSTTTEMTAATVNNAAAAAATKASLIPYANIDGRTVESNQKLLKDFERILQMAIEVYEQKINSM